MVTFSSHLSWNFLETCLCPVLFLFGVRLGKDATGSCCWVIWGLRSLNAAFPCWSCLSYFMIFILQNSRCQVLCGICKKLPRTSLQCCYILSGPSGSLMPALKSVENRVPLKPVWGMLHLFIIPHVQTRSNRVCNSYVILLWLMLPRDHFVSRFLYFTTTGVKCCVAAVKCCPVLHFSVVKCFCSFGIIDTSSSKCLTILWSNPCYLCRVAAVKSLPVHLINDVIFSILQDRSARHYCCACNIFSFNFSAFSSKVVPIFILE
jgi:hypothetical protein